MGEGFWCLRVSSFVKPRISRGMCNRRDNAAGMMRRGLVTVVGFSPHLAEGKGLLLLSENWIGLWERNMSVFREQRHGKK